MKKLLFLLVCLMMVSAGTLLTAKKACGPKSKSCGDTCIAKNKDCHIESKRQSAKKCSLKSKPCGNTCIPLNKVCQVERN